MRPTSHLALAVLIASMPAVARADSNKLEGTFRFEGDVDGHFTGKVVFEPRGDGAFAVKATEERATTVTWEGTAKLAGNVLTVTRNGSNIVAAIDRSSPPPLVYVATFDDDLEKADVKVTRGGEAAGTAKLELKKTKWQKVEGELLGLARKEVDKAIHKEIDLSREYDVLTYGHIGIRGSVQVLDDDDRSAFMKESDDAFRAAGKGDPFWVRSVVEGGPRVAYSTSVPLDAAGTVRVDAGFELGAHVKYTCDDQERIPDGFKDAKGALSVLADEPAHVFALPLTAARAQSLPEGTRRTLEGNGALALSGGISFGYRLEELGALEKKAEVGLNGGVCVTWNLHGDLRLELERQKDALVRLKWTKGTTSQFDAGVQALLGFYVSQAVLDKIPSPESKAVTAVVQQGQKYTTVEFNASAEWMKTNELAIEMLFDLSDEKARSAYERAVRGDLLGAQALADLKTPTGLKEYRVTSTLTDALSFHAKLEAFKVLDASTDRKTTNIHVDVSSLDGTTSSTDVFDYERSGHGLFGDSKKLTAEALSREVVRPDQPAQRGSRVTFNFTGRDDHTWKDELLANIRLGGLLFGPTAVTREWNLISNDDPGPFHHYGKTDMSLEVTLGTTAIEKVLAASYDDLLRTYGHAYWEHDYDWTPARANVLRHESLIEQQDESPAQKAERLEAWDFNDAEKVLKLVMNARRTGAQPKDRVEAFRTIARKDGFKLRAVVAFALIAGEADTHVAFKLSASDWMKVDLQKGSVSALPEHP